MKAADLPMREAALQTSVLDMAARFKVRTAHFRPAQLGTRWVTPVAGDGKGWPDLVLCGRRLLIRELKGTGGTTSADQQVWLAALLAAGVDVGIWTPTDWRTGRIEAELRAISPSPPATPAGIREMT
jgi:hypothetical protein